MVRAWSMMTTADTALRIPARRSATIQPTVSTSTAVIQETNHGSAMSAALTTRKAMQSTFSVKTGIAADGTVTTTKTKSARWAVTCQATKSMSLELKVDKMIASTINLHLKTQVKKSLTSNGSSITRDQLKLSRRLTSRRIRPLNSTLKMVLTLCWWRYLKVTLRSNALRLTLVLLPRTSIGRESVCMQGSLY